MNHPDMPPEVFVRLRLHGLTTEGMHAIRKSHALYDWDCLVLLLDKKLTADAAAVCQYWNELAKEMKADGRLD